MSAAERAAELRSQLEHHNHRYYVLDDPEVGDDVYDALIDELRGIEALREWDLAAPGGPSDGDGKAQ